MKMLRIACWMFFPLIAGTIQSCCDCQGTIEYTYSINDIVISNLNNAGQQPIVAVNDTIGKKAYGLRITCNTTKIAYQRAKPSMFMQSVYAYSCRCNSFISKAKDTLRSIRIFTVNDFDITHLAGADITDYFFEDGKRPLSSGNIFAQVPQFYELSPQPIVFDCMLMQAPVLSSQCGFRVEIILSGGRKYDLLTQLVTLL